MQVTDFTSSPDTLDLYITNLAYTEEGSRPVMHVFGRDSDDNHRHVEVVGHRPSFYIPESAYTNRVDNHYAVHHVERRDEDGNRWTNLDDEPLVRVYTNLPKQVGDLRDVFDEHYEADVLYERRWTIDNGLKTGVRVDTTDTRDHTQYGEIRVDCASIEPLSPDERPDVQPRVVTIDIEVASESGFPDAEDADWPVSSVVAHDSYTDEYTGWLLNPSDGQLDVSDVPADVTVYDDESRLLDDVNSYIESYRPDVLTGWFSNDFDYPYLINRCRELNVWSYYDWSPLDDVYTTKYDPVAEGVSLVDGLGAYKKTQYRNLTSESLDAIAEKELADVKHDVVDGHTEMWRQSPVQYHEYNRKDVELTQRIADESGSLSLIANLRDVTGVGFEEPIGGNYEMMDTVFLRKAAASAIALPTAEKPAVEDYHGAYVYTPTAGLHEHVVYPDYSSLYPNMMYQCNISPETLIGTAEDLAESEYDESDCVWTYIDTTTPPSQKEDVEVTDDEMEKCYFLAPDVEEGFVRGVLDDIMGMCDQYTGDMYDAAKRVRNSTYGSMGDSDSYGSGFRLFDWRLAEGTTLGGQKVLKEGGRLFADFISDPDADVIYGDTDSVVTKLPNADDGEDALAMAEDAADRVNEALDDYVADTFNVETSRMDLEIESYAEAIFFKGQNGGTSDDGVKKRYAQLVAWDDDDDWYDEPDLEITGFEYVRSDVAQLTKRAQYRFFELLFTADDPETAVYEYLEGVIEDVMADEYPLNDIGIPMGIGQPLAEYGSPDRRPQYKYRGAKYARDYIYGDEDAIGEGDRPLEFRVDAVTGDQRKTFDATTAEDGDPVDCVAVHDADDIPPEIHIDRRQMLQKTLVDPLEAMVRTMGWSVERLESAIDDATPADYWRDENQTGLDAENFM